MSDQKLMIPEDILAALTDVKMPTLKPQPAAVKALKVLDQEIPVFSFEAVVLGSGAAGLRAAVELKRRNTQVALLSQSAWGGTSACSGSDKQTLYSANTSDQGDNFYAMSQTLSAGGAMDEDMAYVEAVGSPRAMATLQYLGLAIPQNASGGTLRYQTDHDEAGRATSVGPRTSRFMVQVLAQEAIRLDIPFFNHSTALKILCEETNSSKQDLAGVLVCNARSCTEKNPYGLSYYRCSKLVIATGGPGELYRDSVFPNGCFGGLGLALDTGLVLTNLTESQFGIGTPRNQFPWNLSGTYVQAMPHIYSVDESGKEHHFLADFYRTTQELVSNVFRKGYQWPFHAERMLDFGSSLLDLAVFQESRKGRKVLMDFNRNPLMVPDDQPFSLTRLDEDVARYLSSAGLSLTTESSLPIERLKQLNPLAIELYRRYKVDIAKDPLEFAVNNQHMNGGIAVDTWGQTNVPGIYAVGEAAGTHGVTRPGGAALNAGQVLATRVAEHASQDMTASGCRTSDETEIVEQGVKHLIRCVEGSNRSDEGKFELDRLKGLIQERMSEHAGIFCKAKDVKAALIEARRLVGEVESKGMALDRDRDFGRAIQWYHMALAAEAVLFALDRYISEGGGSRGARAIFDESGELVPKTRLGQLDAYSFRSNSPQHEDQKLLIWREHGTLKCDTVEINKFDATRKSVFERDWPDWLVGRIYDKKHNELQP